MPSTVYKGDLAEVSFAPEVGISIVCAAANDASFVLSHPAAGDHSKLVFTGANAVLFDTNDLRYPDGMLVGSQVKFTRSSGTSIENGDLDRVFTIVGNDGPNLYLSPKMLTGANTIDDANVSLHILPYKTPPLDSTMSQGANSESVLTDQFLGIANALTLPETKMDLKRFHVVGLGRDTSVQVPGKFITEGGSFEVAMHSARWLKYCLGGEVVDSGDSPVTPTGITLNGATEAGQSQITVSNATGFAPTGTNPNKYVVIVDTEYVPVTTTHDADIADAALQWNGTTPFTDTRFDTALRSEARRIIGVVGNLLYLDEPLQYAHATGKTVYLRDYADPANTKAPLVTVSGSTATITEAQTHLLFTNTYQPSFSLEVSQRRRNVDSDEGAVDGGPTDSKELTRVFRGCKVTDFTLTTDNDAALRLAVNFNSALCYTDTARLNGNDSKYAARRMFDDTANNDTQRYASGIAPCTQKPFMFYNGTINMAGVQVAQVLNFSLTGQTGMQAFHTIGGQSSINSATEQVPFGGSRNTNIMVEGQTSYEMTMEIGVDDPLFFHKMRSATEFNGSKEGSADNQIRIDFEKTTTTGETERMMLIIDDYYIIEAPLQIPEDKGMVKSTLKIMPKTIKVIARDTIIKY
jgi:hypothetical protein